MQLQLTIQMAIDTATRTPIHMGPYQDGRPITALCGITLPGTEFTTLRPSHSDCHGCLSNDLTSVQG